MGGEGVNIFKMIKSKKMRWMGCVLHMQETRMALRILPRRSEEMRLLAKEEGVDGKAVLK